MSATSADVISTGGEALRSGMCVRNYARRRKSSYAQLITLPSRPAAMQHPRMDWTDLSDETRAQMLRAYVELRSRLDPKWSIREWVNRAKPFGGPLSDGAVRHFINGRQRSFKQKFYGALARADGLSVNQMLFIEAFPPSVVSAFSLKESYGSRKPTPDMVLLPPPNVGPANAEEGDFTVSQADRVIAVLSELERRLAEGNARQHQDNSEMKELLVRVLRALGDREQEPAPAPTPRPNKRPS